MKKIFLIAIVAAGAGIAVASLVVSRRLEARHASQLAERQAAWMAEKALLEAALQEAKGRPRLVTVPGPAAPSPVVSPSPGARLSPGELVAKLRSLKLTPATQARTLRQALYWLEELAAAGPAALPAIREFLARNEDLDLESATGQGKGMRGGVPSQFVIPPSLRFGLLDVVRQVGGADGEALLAEVLGATGRGVEVAWLARTLQEIAPNKYRELALTAARELLDRPAASNPANPPASPLDRNDRENLFAVLTLYGDNSYVDAAQTQLLRADGQVDRSALRYLQQSLGPQAVAIAARWYDDPRLTEPGAKEAFARLALNYVGLDAQADNFYQKAINDPALSKDHRRNLIEDLNQDGFGDPRNLTARDLPLIQSRISLIEQLAPSAADPINAAAFKEAYKDLLKMRDRVAPPPQ